MELKEIIVAVIGGIILIGTVIYLVLNQKGKITEWLKYAVAEAEKYLGGGTGQLKLRRVYDWFTERFPILAAILPFRVFSAWVDVALETLDKWNENKNIEKYVKGA